MFWSFKNRGCACFTVHTLFSIWQVFNTYANLETHAYRRLPIWNHSFGNRLAYVKIPVLPCQKPWCSRNDSMFNFGWKTSWAATGFVCQRLNHVFTTQKEISPIKAKFIRLCRATSTSLLLQDERSIIELQLLFCALISRRLLLSFEIWICDFSEMALWQHLYRNTAGRQAHTCKGSYGCKFITSKLDCCFLHHQKSLMDNDHF